MFPKTPLWRRLLGIHLFEGVGMKEKWVVINLMYLLVILFSYVFSILLRFN